MTTPTGSTTSGGTATPPPPPLALPGSEVATLRAIMEQQGLPTPTNPGGSLIDAYQQELDACNAAIADWNRLIEYKVSVLRHEAAQQVKPTQDRAAELQRLINEFKKVSKKSSTGPTPTGSGRIKRAVSKVTG